MFCLRSRPRLSVHNLIQNFRRRACRLWGLQSLTRSAGLAWHRKHRTCRRLRLRARSVPLGRSRWPIEPGRLRWGARNGRSNSLELARLRRCARNCMAWLVESIAPPDFTISSPPGSAGALNIAARARSAALGRSKWPLELARLRQSARNCSARLLENITHVDVSEFEPARLYWGPRHWRSRPLGSAGAPEIAAGT
jgi:hypothetical protein